MVTPERLICASDALADGGDGVRFEVDTKAGRLPAFVVRFEGQPQAFVNQCAHVPVELDWQEGAFFDADRRYLICATHGATYDPVSGACVFGPCRGAALKKLTVVEAEGGVWLAESDA